MAPLTHNEIVLIVIAAAGLCVLAGYGISTIMTRPNTDEMEDDIRRGADAQAGYMAAVRRKNREIAYDSAHNRGLPVMNKISPLPAKHYDANGEQIN
ncbi:MAG: hypothetical protein Q9160_007916 [Pyrenula sp. 1 TL-2023]